MQTKEIEQRLKVIASLSKDDPEAATVEQFKLYEDFIEYITTLSMEGTLPTKAGLVLSARAIPFRRTL